MSLLVAIAMMMLLMMTHESLAAGSSCLRSHGRLFDRSRSHMLTGHSFLNQSGTVLTQCEMLCVRHRMCLSFNHDDIGGMCQLNDARKEDFPEIYKRDDSFSYFDRLVSRVYGSLYTEAQQQALGDDTHPDPDTTPGNQVCSLLVELTESALCLSNSLNLLFACEFTDFAPGLSNSPKQLFACLGWQLVFKGVAGTGIKLYNLWTNRTWDSDSENSGNYRNETLYNAWTNGQNIKQVKLSLFDHTGVKVELIFNGVDSDITSWFAKERLVSSPWSDLTTTATTNYFSIKGHLLTGQLYRRFFINKNYGGCDVDRGWLTVVDSADNCQWGNSFSSYPVILYSTQNTAVNWTTSNAGELGIADYLTIHIDTE
ncbi:uncharacterized protein [Asterias amurensis]|uniref:uncharacterized protein n=1 Tax=Asterias amurensis TaxID=7602 RepID=UPI003AB87865